MAFCGTCKIDVQEGVKFCPNCGTAVDAGQAAADQVKTPVQDSVKDAEDNRAMSILAYILFFIPLLTGTYKTSPFVKYHTNQGTVLFLASLAFSIVLGILSAIITGIFTVAMAWQAILVITGIFGVIWMVYGLGVTALAVLGIINAVKGKMNPLPVIGKFNIIK